MGTLVHSIDAARPRQRRRAASGRGSQYTLGVDEDRMRQILCNLLSNAVKSPPRVGG